jgi:hypothetical protein
MRLAMEAYNRGDLEVVAIGFQHDTEGRQGHPPHDYLHQVEALDTVGLSS